MKKLIFILFMLAFIGVSSQEVQFYPVNAGQYIITNVGGGDSITLDTRYTRNGVIGHRNHVEVVDTIFKVPATASLDTISNFTRPTGKKAAILLERGGHWRESITFSDDSLSLGAYGTGEKPIIDGTDVISGFNQDWDATNIPYITISDSTERNAYADFESFTDSADMVSKYVAYNSGGAVFTWDLNTVAPIDNSQDGRLIVTTAGTSFSNPIIRAGLANLIPGYWFKLTFDYKVNSGVCVLYRWGSGSNTFVALNDTLTGSGTYTAYGLATAAQYAQLYFDGRNEFDVQLDNVSVVGIDSVDVWQKTGVSTQPYLMYLNDTIGDLQTSVDALDSEGDWFWDNSDNTLYVYTQGGDPSGNVEIGQRRVLINTGFSTSFSDITVSDLIIRRGNQRDEAHWYGGIHAVNSSGLLINNCTVQQCNGYGVFLSDMSDVTIQNSVFLENGINSTNYQHFADNIRYYSYNSGNSNVVFKNNVSNGAGRNGFFVGSSNIPERVYADNFTVYGNTFNDNKAAGLYLQKANKVVIYDNTFDGNGDLDDPGEDYAIGITRGDSIEIYQNTITNQLNNDAIQLYSDNNGILNNVKIYRNYISGVTNGDCIGIAAYGDYSMTNSQIFYNVLSGASQYGVRLDNGGTGTPSSIDIFNNTIYDNAGGGVDIQTANFPAAIKNNIFSANGVPDIDALNSSTGLTTSNNLYYRTSGDVLEYNSATYTMATITNFEPTAQTGDPLFTDAPNGDFTLQAGSPAINAGVDVGLTHDILGNPIVGNPDIGAYELQTP